MSAALVPTLTQYSVPDYVHMNNIPAHHFQRPAGPDPVVELMSSADGADQVSGGGALDPGSAGRSGLGIGGTRPKPIVMGAK